MEDLKVEVWRDANGELHFLVPGSQPKDQMELVGEAFIDMATIQTSLFDQ